jgi:threonine/homoserine/homoserine lactone efflux protein
VTDRGRLAAVFFAALLPPWQARVERVTGAVLVGLGVRLALERR